MPIDPTPALAASSGHALAEPRRAGRPRRSLDYQALVHGAFAVFIFCGMLDVIEPSFYDLTSLIALPLWFLGGFRIHRFIIPFLFLIFVYNLAGFIALVPYLNEPDPTLFMLQSLYLAVTVVFFALFFAEDAERRAELCLKAFTASTIVAATLGIIGYFQLWGLGDLLSRYGRASGTFKDPNVLGSYLIMGAVAMMQTLIFRRTRYVAATVAALLIVFAGIFLTFSRGSWSACVVAVTLSIGLAFVTARDAGLRRRIVIVGLAALILAGVVIVALLALPATRDFFLQRATLLQDYDDGATGRFGNQWRSLPMLLDLPNGFGPLRFRLTFGLEPHNSYINAFASYGWLGGCTFFLLVGLTFFVGFRLTLTPSPYRRVAQVFWPSLMVSLLQALQIDIDHWRFVYLMLGAVWGLETARIKWQTQQRRSGMPR